MRYTTSVQPGGAATDTFDLPQLHDLRRLYQEAGDRDNTDMIADFLEWVEQREYIEDDADED